MFSLEPTSERSDLDEAIKTLFHEMSSESGDSEEYAAMVDQLTKLYALKETDSKQRVSPDTMAIVVGNLLGIVLITRYERLNVITSKALSFVLKLR